MPTNRHVLSGILLINESPNIDFLTPQVAYLSIQMWKEKAEESRFRAKHLSKAINLAHLPTMPSH
ncbi:hypothetical protein RvY_03891 [Ramazzottius varieornatus]|uniref:Uncharacterized protein n=1 Tax=Ramazzottius varieornatus TaxID=947166 RepID=A0A1D1UQF6_RAMVA|nr:hypothetical protein RvY_03891 [Ramazzottius varieornatus]